MLKQIITLIVVTVCIQGCTQPRRIGITYSQYDNKRISDLNVTLDWSYTHRFKTDSNGCFDFRSKKKNLGFEFEWGNEIHKWSSLGVTASSLKDTIKIYLKHTPGYVKGLRDTSKGKIVFYQVGESIAPYTEAEAKFAKDYSITYYYSGCTDPFEGVAGYNQLMALYMDKKLGTSWRQFVRNVPGVKKVKVN